MQQDATLNHGNLPPSAPAILGTVDALQQRIDALAQSVRERRARIAELEARNGAEERQKGELCAQLAEALGGLVIVIDTGAGSMRSFASSRLAAAGLAQS